MRYINPRTLLFLLWWSQVLTYWHVLAVSPGLPGELTMSEVSQVNWQNHISLWYHLGSQVNWRCLKYHRYWHNGMSLRYHLGCQVNWRWRLRYHRYWQNGICLCGTGHADWKHALSRFRVCSAWWNIWFVCFVFLVIFWVYYNNYCTDNVFIITLYCC